MPAPESDHHERGRNATEPEQIPARGWWDITMRVYQDLSRDNVSLIAGGLAMYSLLSVFPALAAAVSIYGLVFRPDDVIKQMQVFAGVLPPGVWDIFNGELQEVVRRESGTLTITAIIALLVSLGSARSGMASLVQATNIAYQEQEKRSLLRQILLSILFTIGAIGAFLLVLLLGVAVPVIFSAVNASAWIQDLIGALRWALLWLFATAGLACIYRFAPSRQMARWRWVIWGSVVAASLWLAGSILFAVYVRTFGGYARTYGALGGVIVLMMWFYLSSFLLVLGAEINAEMERQTRRDTTEGPEAPLGKRGAWAADTVGPSASEPGNARQNPRDAPKG